AGLEGVGRAEGAGPCAGLGYVTSPEGGSTPRAASLEGIGWAEGAGPCAGLSHVTHPCLSTADGGRRLKLTGGRATEAGLPVMRSEVTLLVTLHQAIAARVHLLYRKHAAAAGPRIEGGGRLRVDRQGRDIGVGEASVDRTPGRPPVGALEHAGAIRPRIEGGGRLRVDGQGRDKSGGG